jgi:uncharacterized protein
MTTDDAPVRGPAPGSAEAGAAPDASEPATEPDPTSPPPGAPPRDDGRAGAEAGAHTDAHDAGPVIAHDVDRPLDPRIVAVWRLGAVIGLVVPLGAAMLLALILPVPGWIIALPTAILVGATIGPWQSLRWRHWSWRLSDAALELRSGVIVRRHVTLPHFRVQQIDVLEGPLERLLGLATLTVTTASAGGSASLPGLRVEDAPAIRRELLALAARANAQLGDGGRDAV